MNHVYRLLWNEITQTWVAVSETAKSCGKRASGIVLLTASGFAVAAPAPDQLPSGGKISAGQASITQSGTRMDINQSSTRAVIDWQTFNVGVQAQIHFSQPSPSSAILNRVIDTQASQIFGRITANGQVFLSNPNGVYFAPSATVDVGALVATTHAISNSDFMAGRYSFSRNGATGSVVNEGSLKAALGGYIALLAPEVRNQGIVVAQMGTVVLAAGEAYELQFDSNNTLANLRVTPAAIKTLVDNGRAVQAPGGLIILSAQAVNQVQGSVVNNSGTLEATAIAHYSGRIFLDAGDSGEALVSGQMSVSSPDGKGGDITVTGTKVHLTSSAFLDATGGLGGGNVQVGGSWQGQNASIRQSLETQIDPGARLDASATVTGDGGTVVAWSDVANLASVTRAYGTFLANGGVNGGNGGRVETSGHAVDTAGAFVSASALKGQSGLWLIDPADATITQAVADGYVATLNTGTSVTNTVTGNIVASGNVSLTKTAGSDATLTLQATGYIALVNAASYIGTTSSAKASASSVVIGSTLNKLNLVFNPGSGGGAGGFWLPFGSSLTTNGGNVTIGGGISAVAEAVGTGIASYENNALFRGASINGNINAGGGNITVLGAGANGAGVLAARGVSIGGSISTMGTGTIGITGTGFGASDGVGLGDAVVLLNGSLSAANGAISVTGTKGTLNAINIANAGSSIATTGTGSVTLNALSGVLNTLGSIDSSGAVLLKAQADIITGAGSSITTHNQPVVFWANSSATGGYISLGDNAPITTNGGSLWLGGGSGTVTWNGLTVGDGYAQGRTTGNPAGIFISNGAIATGGGSIAMYGQSASGVIGGTNPDALTNIAGIVRSYNNQYSINAGSGKIYMKGVSVASDSRYVGDALYLNGGTLSSTAPSGDAITLIGDASAANVATNHAAGIAMIGWNAAKSNSISATGGGNIVVTGTSVNNDANAGDYSSGIRFDMVSPGTNTLLTSGGGNIVLTGTTSDTGAHSFAVASSAADMITASGSLVVNGSNREISLLSKNTITGTTALSVSGQNITASNTLNDFGGAVTVSSGRNVVLTDSNAMLLGAITATGTIDIATLTGDLTLSGTISTSDTSGSALKLNAGKNVAAGTASGGNIVLSGSPTISVGTGGFATLYTGSVTGSAALAAQVGSGSGRFRYNSDEAVSNFTTALTAGSNVLFREQPSITVTASNAVRSYSGTAYSGGNGMVASGLVNGDAVSTLTGTLAYSGSAQGSVDVGSYNIVPGGYSNGLGYALVYAGGTLTTSAVPLTITASNANKIYDGLSYSGGSGVTYSGFVGGQNAAVLGGTLAYGGASQGAIAPGNYAITPSGYISGNYTIGYVDGVLNIARAANASVVLPPVLLPTVPMSSLLVSPVVPLLESSPAPSVSVQATGESVGVISSIPHAVTTTEESSAATGSVSASSGGAAETLPQQGVLPTSVSKATMASLLQGLSGSGSGDMMSSLASNQVNAAVTYGLPADQATQAGKLFSQALAQQLSRGVPMNEAVAQAGNVFQTEASFPAPKSAQEAVAKNVLASGADIGAKLDSLSGATTATGTGTFDKVLSIALAKGMNFDEAVQSAQTAGKQAEMLAQADKSSQSALASGGVAQGRYANSSPSFQKTLSVLLEKGFPPDQAMAKAEEAARSFSLASGADEHNALSGIASGNFLLPAGATVDGTFGKALSAMLAKGVPFAQALDRATQSDAVNQRGIATDARSSLSGFSNGAGTLPEGNPNFDRALAVAVSRGESLDKAIELARQSAEKVPRDMQTASSALASGRNVDEMLGLFGRSQIFRSALGWGLAKGLPVDQAIKLANQAESANAFRYPLPGAAAILKNAKITIKMTDGKPLPSWLHYEPKERVFVAPEIPDGALPLTVVVAVGAKQLQVTIAEGTLRKAVVKH